MEEINLKEQLAEQAKKSEKREVSKVMTIPDMIKAMEPEIKKALPSVITPERFTRIALSATSNNPELTQCTPISFISALLNAAQLGLEPNTPLGQAGRLLSQLFLSEHELLVSEYDDEEFQAKLQQK